MQGPYKFILLSIIALSLVGCATNKPPGQFEQVIFNTQTNWITQVAVVTNEVWETNIAVVSVTNQIGQIVKETNEIFIPKYETVSVTSTVPTYIFTPSTNAIADAQMIGGIANVFLPGSGGIIGGLLVGALGVWGRMRSYKKSGTVLAQNIEAIREFIKSSVPEGKLYDEALVKFMKDKQQEAGAIDNVLGLLRKYVSNKDAQVAATEIQNLLDTIRKP